MQQASLKVRRDRWIYFLKFGKFYCSLFIFLQSRNNVLWTLSIRKRQARLKRKSLKHSQTCHFNNLAQFLMATRKTLRLLMPCERRWWIKYNSSRKRLMKVSMGQLTSHISLSTRLAGISEQVHMQQSNRQSTGCRAWFLQSKCMKSLNWWSFKGRRA